MKKTFDLIDYCVNTPSLYLRMQLLSSLAWRVDTTIVQQCRALFKLLKLTPLAMTLDGDAELRAAVAEGKWTEQLFGEAGSETTPLVKTITQLTCMRLVLHELAAYATLLVPYPSGSPRPYNTPELEDIFQPGGSTEPKGESLLRMQMSAERNAARLGDKEKAKELTKRFLEQRVRIERANIAAMKHNMANQVDSLLALHSYVMREVDSDINADFTALHIDVRKTLIESMLATVDRAVQTAESRPNEVTFDDFCHLLTVADKAKDELKKALDHGEPTPMRVRKLESPPAPTAASKADADLKAHKDQVKARLEKPKTVRTSKPAKPAKQITLKKIVEAPAPTTAVGQAMVTAAQALADMPEV
jgi:hypothetical protein